MNQGAAEALDLGAETVLLTGATGWLGRRLARAVRQEIEDVGLEVRPRPQVRCLVPQGEDRRELEDLGCDVVAGDLAVLDDCRAFLAEAEGALVIHIAGLVHPRLRVREFDAVNVVGTANLFEAAREARVGRFLAMSSNSPIGFNPRPDHRFVETSAYRPYMGYGRSKESMEIALRQEMALPGVPAITIIRAPWFYGPGQPPRQTVFFSMIRAGKFPLVGNGLNRRSLGYVDNLSQGILRAAATEAGRDEIFWLADAEPYSMLEIIEAVRATLSEDFGLSVSPRRPRLPGLAADVARLLDGAIQGLGFYQQKIHVLSEMNLTIACSIDKARRELGYAPKVALREGMRSSIQWCLDQGMAI